MFPRESNQGGDTSDKMPTLLILMLSLCSTKGRKESQIKTIMLDTLATIGFKFMALCT